MCVCVFVREREGERTCHSVFVEVHGREDNLSLLPCFWGRASYFFCTVYFSLPGPWTSAKSLVFDSQSCSRSTGIIGVCHCVRLFKGGSEDLIEIARLVLPATSSPCPCSHSFSWWSITPPPPIYLFRQSFILYPRWLLLASDSRCSCFSLTAAGIAGICHHVQSIFLTFDHHSRPVK